MDERTYARLSPEAKRIVDAARAESHAAKPNKYRAKPIEVNGKKFPSTKEGKRYSELLMMVKAGEVRWFCRQPRFDIEGGEYRPDFIIMYATGELVIEDVKGVRTALYVRSKKQMLERYGIDIKES
jgi:hypothetical protein